MPSFTIISCIGQLVRAGATPVLVDSDPLTWNMDVSLIEEKITARTRAIMVVHTYGLPVDMDPVLDIAQRHDLLVIEDAAEAHGLRYRGRPCGSFGVFSTFSFYPNKHVTTGEGGMILTDDDRLAEDCRSLRNLCFRPEKRFVHDRLGWNFRMSNLQAALGVAQLERLDEFTARKRRLGARYSERLKDLEGLQLPLPATGYAENIYWVYGILVDADRKQTADESIRELGAQGIGCRPFFCPMHQQPVLLKMGLFAGERYPVAEGLYQKGFYIPSGIGMTDQQIDTVVNALQRTFS
jgi:perosamine synthetase